MIPGGMAPVVELRTTGGRLFTACYAFVSGLFIRVVAGGMFGPVVISLPAPVPPGVGIT
jgi:hypothetical protein